MCSPDTATDVSRGFTLLEIQVALVLLALAMFGYVRLAGAQSSAIDSLDAWCQGEPTFLVVAASSPTERQIGMPAQLLDEGDSPPSPADQPEGENEVTILAVDRSVMPMNASVLVEVLVPEEEDDDDEDPEDERERKRKEREQKRKEERERKRKEKERKEAERKQKEAERKRAEEARKQAERERKEADKKRKEQEEAERKKKKEREKKKKKKKKSGNPAPRSPGP